MKYLKRTLIIIGAVLALLILVIAILIPVSVRRGYPQIAGDIKVPGLNSPVTVRRDEFGVPHIYAKDQHDLFFAQGYIHSQDRFWQMDMWRHQGAGRLSELLGSNTVDIDIYLRTLGWERVAKEEVAMIDPDTREILEAYSAGVNAYLAEFTGTELGLEYLFLNVVNAGYKPQPWTPLNSFTWAKAMAWDLGGNFEVEIYYALTQSEMPPDLFEDFFIPYNFDRPVIVTEPHITASSQPSPATPSTVNAALRPQYQNLLALNNRVNNFTGGGFEGIGSNSWVVSGDLTNTGMPLLANDPHLGAQLPSIWYEIGLHCETLNSDCPYDVTGFSFAGVPGVVIGHNNKIAWGFTNVGPDVQDLYIEKINPDNPNQYEVNGQWVDMELVTETINVAGGDPVEITARLTRHGPILTDVSISDYPEWLDVEGDPANYAIALQWTALEPNFTFRAIWKLNRAQNFDDFRLALQDFAVPAQNIIYADTEGNIGYQMPGNIPIRAEGHEGLYPVPGWTDENEWQGYIPYEHPFAYNPTEGYIVTANNAVVGPEYPYTISQLWDYGYRAQSIVDLIENAPGKIDIPYIQTMQGENRDMSAEILLPVLMKIDLNNSELTQIRDRLKGWNYQAHMDSTPAAIYEVFWSNLARLAFEDELGGYSTSSGSFIRMETIIDDPNNTWWDNKNTAAMETRDEIFVTAFTDAVAELKDTLGKNPDKWTWGDLHTLTFTHSFMNSFPVVDKLFNRGPFRSSGGNSIVNATGWDAELDYTVNWLPSMRMIVDLSNLDNSLTMHTTTGQSGHPYDDTYMNMADHWRLIEYHPMLWSPSQVEAGGVNMLMLNP